MKFGRTSKTSRGWNGHIFWEVLSATAWSKQGAGGHLGEWRQCRTCSSNLGGRQLGHCPMLRLQGLSILKEIVNGGCCWEKRLSIAMMFGNPAVQKFGYYDFHFSKIFTYFHQRLHNSLWWNLEHLEKLSIRFKDFERPRVCPLIHTKTPAARALVCFSASARRSLGWCSAVAVWGEVGWFERIANYGLEYVRIKWRTKEFQRMKVW